jgi:hypothetical protein
MKRTHRGVKTTLEIPELLWRATKQRALDEDLDMRAVVIRALEAFLGLGPFATERPAAAGRQK